MYAVRSLFWDAGKAKSEAENETVASAVVGLGKGSNRGPAESETQREPKAPRIRMARRQKIPRVVLASLITGELMILQQAQKATKRCRAEVTPT
jgi:hypothetical protein